MGQPRASSTVLLEKCFSDGRRAQVLHLDGKVLARVFAASGRLYIEHSYDDIGEATTTILEWDGEGWPLSEWQRQHHPA